MPSKPLDCLSPRESSVYIADHCSDVRVNETQLSKLQDLVFEDAKNKAGVFAEVSSQHLWRDVKPHGTDEEKLSWVFITSALNFSFWTEPGSDKKYAVTYKGQAHTGYWSLCACFNRSLEAGMPLLSPDYLSKISHEDAEKVFTGDHGMIMPMLQQRIDVMHEVGDVLIKDFGGSAAKLVAAGEQSVQKLVQFVSDHFPCLRDVATFKGKEVSFYKRAQIFCCDLNSVFNSSGYGKFNDFDTLTAFADYRIPQVLVYYGIMEYPAEVTEKLTNGPLLTPGESLEVEIRGCSIYAIDKLTEAVNKALKLAGSDQRVTAAKVDNYLWNHRRENAKTMAHVPFHRIRTIFY